MTATSEQLLEMPMWVNGRAVTALGDWIKVIDPAQGEPFARVPKGDVIDVDRAVSCARAAFPAWSRTLPAERAAVLLRLADLLEAHRQEFAELESRNTGKTIRMSRDFDLAGSIDNIRFFAGAARALEGRASAEYMPGITSVIRREPIGVIASIAPWNYPLQMAVWKVCPALGAGNTVVLKPASLTPLTAIRLAQLASEAGAPPGVFNVVTGPGERIGSALVGHPGVDMVSLTGDTATGVEVMRAAAAGLKRVHLELGGKAPFLVFSDADLEAAANGAIAGGFINVGQDCTAATRFYVERTVYERFRALLLDRVATIRLGDPFANSTDLGPLISARHRDRVAGFVERARSAGATIIAGGEIPGGPLVRGAYYRPTVIEGAAQDSEIVQAEVFGPVVVVLPFTTEAEAIQLANDVEFGLAASVWTSNVQRAMRLARDIHFGTVWVNEHIPITSEMPHGGVKRSGTGKDMSQYSLDEYTIVKHVALDIAGEARKSWHDVIWRGR